jgi:threonine/homoserine/homoserine lactone efflux protein
MLIFLAGIAIGVIGLLLLLVVGVYRLVRRPPALTEVPRSGDPDVPES